MINLIQKVKNMKKFRVLTTSLLIVCFILLTFISGLAEYDIKSNYNRVSRDLEKLRELKFKKAVPYSMKTRDFLKKHLGQVFREELPPEKLKAYDMSLKLFGFVPENFDTYNFLIKLYTEQIAGMYDLKSKNMMLLKDGNLPGSDTGELASIKSMGIDPNDLFLIHEMQHALQDQHFDIGKKMEQVKAKNNDDKTYAFHAVLEGDAYIVMMYYMFDKMSESMGGGAISDMLDMTSMRNLMGDVPVGTAGSTFAAAPLFFKRTLLFPYLDGMVFIEQLKKRGGWSSANQAFMRIPQSTEQILNVNKYLNNELPINIKFSSLPRELGGYRTLEDNVFGEMVMRIYFEQHLPSSDFKSIAAGWGGDRYRTYGKGNDGFLVMYTSWDTEQDSREFFDAYLLLLKAKYKDLKWVKTAPGTAFLGSSRERHCYVGKRGKDVLVFERVPPTLTQTVITQGWKVEKQ
jgi:hypothetical protein